MPEALPLQRRLGRVPIRQESFLVLGNGLTVAGREAACGPEPDGSDKADVYVGKRPQGVGGSGEKRTMQKSWRHRFHLPAVIGTIPMILVAVGVFVIGIGFSVLWSFTSSKLFPTYDFVGLAQYRRLWADNRWLVSVNNIWFFGLMSITCNMVFGYLLAVFMDQRIREEDLFRSIFLYPFAMSLIVTGLVWQWMLDPNLGLQAALRNWGLSSFSFAPLADAADRAVRAGRRGHLAGLGRDDGDPACRPARR